MKLSAKTQKKAERLLKILEIATGLASQIQREAYEQKVWPSAGTAGHIYDAMRPTIDPEGGLLAAARALAEKGGQR